MGIGQKSALNEVSIIDMLYVNISEATLEVIKTSKRILKNESIVAANRTAIPEGTMAHGIVFATDSFLKLIQDLSQQLDVSGRQDIALAITNSSTQVARFQISSNTTAALSQKIVEQAKKSLEIDLSEYENFYKIISTTPESSTILFTTMPKTTISLWIETFAKIGWHVQTLTTRAFALHEIVKPLIPIGQRVLFADLSGKKVEYSVFDHDGVITTHDKKISKSLAGETKSFIKKLTQDTETKIDTIYLSGEDSIGENALELSKELSATVVKFNDVMDELLTSVKLTFDSGGTPKVFYVHTLGLILHGRDNESANFALGFKKPHTPPVKPVSQAEKQSPEQIHEENEESLSEIQEQEKKQEVMPTTPPLTVLPKIVEYQTSGISRYISAKTLQLILLFVAVAAIAFGLIIVVGGASSGIKIPFLAGPTLTPTPTVEPTFTPTPTVDPTLKRSDLKVSVQNGTERTGYAKEIADFLESKDYEKVARSNAEGNLALSEIHIKEAKRPYLPTIIEDLKDKIDTTTVKTLEESSKYDVIIILGEK